jgi:hypothetical protein
LYFVQFGTGVCSGTSYRDKSVSLLYSATSQCSFKPVVVVVVTGSSGSSSSEVVVVSS